MPVGRHFTRIDTLQLKAQIARKLGHARAEKYFYLLTRFLSLKISKTEFDKLCIGIIGRENICLHNQLLRSILKNAYLSETPPPKGGKVEGTFSVKVPNGYQRSTLQSLCRDIPQSPRKGRTPNFRDPKFKDRPSPLGPHGKSHSAACEDSAHKVPQQSATELLSLGSRPPGSVEDGEEVDQAAGSPGIYSRSPVRAPLGISIGTQKVLYNRLASACHDKTSRSSGELPDTKSLRKRLEQKLDALGLTVSLDCANLLNNSLDVFMKRLIKPCLELAGSRSGHKHIDQRHGNFMHSLNGVSPGRYVPRPSGTVSGSILDFRIAVELNPQILGEDWPIQLEKVCLRASEDRMEID
ncbi:SAGA-Tad1 domain-containing protein [Cephalotus follicularis]|uniref:SAGA-Tad1 domain-containing protein n=1 Tax=Cephalotus follicularis TaxID=3775 RepID=A0A1Q3AST6_CEPFO|nr:SAGA-Tad1 domain-containing protein [Cephalotus follicularis]